jgi:PPK2 family polyphosphate:nucleotide phosphotransferase
MLDEKFIERAKKFANRYRIDDGNKFKLKHIDSDDTGKLEDEDKPRSKELLAEGIEVLAALQDMLYAQDRWAVLLIFQAMDAAGKDGAIKHVLSGVNPQGCQVFSFKSPSAQDLDHDYLWRCIKDLPERGRIGIFNRSYYEEVLVVRVHPEYLRGQKIPKKLMNSNLWQDRYKDIRNFERYLSRNGTVVRKFFLHVSRKEQKKRFLERIDNPDKNWKLSVADAKERGYWKDYMNAYEDMIRNTSTEYAPWYVVPADNKWFSRIVVASAVIDTFGSLDLHYPVVDDAKKKELQVVKKTLLAQK